MTRRRPTLAEIRRDLLVQFAFCDTWRSTSELHRTIRNTGDDYYRVGLVLERLAADGHAELQVRGPVRRFRRRRWDHDAAGEAAGRSTP